MTTYFATLRPHLLLGLLVILSAGVLGQAACPPPGDTTSYGTIFAADYGVRCDNTTDTAPMLQAAITAARRAQSGEPYLGKPIVMPQTSNRCVLGSTILIEDTRGLSFDGRNAKFTWAGPSTDPMFRFRDARNSDFHHFEVQPSNPTSAVFRFESGAGSFTSTTNELHHIFVECYSAACTFGIEMEIGGGGDNQNDWHMFHHMSFNNVTRACAYINGSQSKAIAFEDFECFNNGTGQYVIETGNDRGSFHCTRCRGGGSAVTDFYLPNKVDNVSIQMSLFEGSKRFLVTGGATGEDWTILITGTRWLADQMHADGQFIINKHRGPLVLIGNFFEQAYNKPLQIYTDAFSGISSVVSIGNAFASNLADVYTGSAKGVISFGNLITNNSFENDDTHMDHSIRLADATFAQLGTSPWTTMRNGNITYCTNCTKTTPCAGSGTGALAKRLNGAWDCN